MSGGMEGFMAAVQKNLITYSERFVSRYGQQVIDILDFPFKVALSPITLAFDIVGSSYRGFGIPELASRLSFSAIFVVLTLGTTDIALEMGKKVLCQRNCLTCNGWKSLRCTMCKGSGKVHYQVQNYRLKSGERATAECIAQAVTDNRAELVDIPSSIDFSIPLPTKDCQKCNGTGVMSCPDCKYSLPLRISADDIMEPPWKALNVMRKIRYPYEHIAYSMKDPKMAAFWLFTFPQVTGRFTYDDETKQKIWMEYKVCMQYNLLRNEVAERKPGWEHLQNALVSLNPVRARDDPVIVKNIPYYKAMKALEAEVMKLPVPPRPCNWGDLDFPLTVPSLAEGELNDTLQSAQRDMTDNILDEEWEAQWRKNKFRELVDEKMQPYVQSANDILHPLIAVPSPAPENEKKTKRRRWWFF